MKRLGFPLKDIKEMYEAFKDDDKAQMILVKDQGVYLMVDRKSKTTEKKFVIYAKGYNPDVDEDWYDNARYDLGGDDFADYLPLKEMLETYFKLKPNARVFSLNVSDTQIALAL